MPARFPTKAHIMASVMDREELERFLEDLHFARTTINKRIESSNGATWRVQSVRIENQDRRPRPEIIVVCDHKVEAPLSAVTRVIGW